MLLNTVIRPELYIYMRFFSTSKGHSEAPPYRISKEMKTCAPGWSVRLLLLESWAKVRLRTPMWAFWTSVRGCVAGLKDEAHLLRWGIKLLIWPSGNEGKETGVLPTQNQPGQEALNVAEFHLFFSNDGREKHSAAFRIKWAVSHERWMTSWEADVANLTANCRGTGFAPSAMAGPFIPRWHSEARLQHENLIKFKD